LLRFVLFVAIIRKNTRRYFIKLIHLSDLHLGKRVNEVSMIEEQEYILHQIPRIIKAEKADAVAAVKAN